MNNESEGVPGVVHLDDAVGGQLVVARRRRRRCRRVEHILTQSIEPGEDGSAQPPEVSRRAHSWLSGWKANDRVREHSDTRLALRLHVRAVRRRQDERLRLGMRVGVIQGVGESEQAVLGIGATALRLEGDTGASSGHCLTAIRARRSE